MKQAEKKALLGLPIILLLGWGIGFAGSQSGATFMGYPVFAMAIALAFLINWVMFIPAYVLQTEKYFDLTGSLSYILIILLALGLSPVLDARAILVTVLVVIWAVRLGAFLFKRIHRAGKDGRFDEAKPSFLRFLSFWTLQGLWISITFSAALATITTTRRLDLDTLAYTGLVVWLLGFVIESVADSQKTRFKRDPANQGKFIQSGLWSRSRHPNYFGEILIWIGVALIAVPVLTGWQWFVIISPIFVVLLLTRVSGIPILEQRSDENWGGQEDYEAYKDNTPVLIPKIFS